MQEDLNVPWETEPDDGIVVPWETDQQPINQTAQPESSGSTLGALARTVSRIPENVLAKGIEAVQGQTGASVTDRGFLDNYVNLVNKRNRGLAEEYANAGDVPLTGGLISKKDVAELGPNLAYSGLSMLGSYGGKAAGVLAGSVAGPVGAVAGGLAGGMAAGGTLAHRMTTYETMNDWLDKKNEESIRNTGRGITPEEEAKYRGELSKYATESGLWEAVPEAAGNLAEMALMKTPAGKIIEMLPDKLKNKVAANALRLGGMVGTEMLTETPTQMGQQITESKAGMSDEKQREWTNPEDWLQSAKEVAPAVVLQSLAMGGGASVYDAIPKKKTEQPSQIDQLPQQETPQLDSEYEQADKEDRGARSIIPVDQKINKAFDTFDFGGISTDDLISHLGFAGDLLQERIPSTAEQSAQVFSENPNRGLESALDIADGINSGQITTPYIPDAQDKTGVQTNVTDRDIKSLSLNDLKKVRSHFESIGRTDLLGTVDAEIKDKQNNIPNDLRLIMGIMRDEVNQGGVEGRTDISDTDKPLVVGKASSHQNWFKKLNKNVYDRFKALGISDRGTSQEEFNSIFSKVEKGLTGINEIDTLVKLNKELKSAKSKFKSGKITEEEFAAAKAKHAEATKRDFGIKNLTANQAMVWEEMQKIGQEYNSQHPEAVDALNEKHFTEQGLSYNRKQPIQVEDLQFGDKLVIEKDGMSETFEVKGMDDEGNVILKDGELRKIAPFDTVNDVVAVGFTDNPKEPEKYTSNRIKAMENIPEQEPQYSDEQIKSLVDKAYAGDETASAMVFDGDGALLPYDNIVGNMASNAGLTDNLINKESADGISQIEKESRDATGGRFITPIEKKKLVSFMDTSNDYSDKDIKYLIQMADKGNKGARKLVFDKDGKKLDKSDIYVNMEKNQELTDKLTGKNIRLPAYEDKPIDEQIKQHDIELNKGDDAYREYLKNLPTIKEIAEQSPFGTYLTSRMGATAEGTASFTHDPVTKENIPFWQFRELLDKAKRPVRDTSIKNNYEKLNVSDKKPVLSKEDVKGILDENYSNKGRSLNNNSSEWLDSDKFILAEIPIDSVGETREMDRKDISTNTSGPIIVDSNVNDIQTSMAEYGEPHGLVVVDGNQRLWEARQRGDKTIKAYVGEKAYKQIFKESEVIANEEGETKAETLLSAGDSGVSSEPVKPVETVGTTETKPVEQPSQEVFSRDSIAVGKESNIDGEFETKVSMPLLDNESWGKVDLDKRDAFVVGKRDFKTGFLPKKKEPMWSVFVGRGKNKLIAQGLTYAEAIDKAKDHVYSANNVQKVPEAKTEQPSSTEQIKQAISKVESKGDFLHIAKIRAELPNMDKGSFDSAMKEVVKSGEFSWMNNAQPTASLSKAQKDSMIEFNDDGRGMTNYRELIARNEQPSFAGILSQTQDMESLLNARSMERNGASKEEIWKKTGWWKFGNDWKYEISNDSSLDVNGSFSGRLGDVFKDENIEKAYPFVSDLKLDVEISNNIYFDEGVYKPASKTISVKSNSIESAKKNILHEVQHAIQGYEGFSSGGTSKNVSIDGEPSYEERLKLKGLISDFRKLLRSFPVVVRADANVLWHKKYPDEKTPTTAFIDYPTGEDALGALETYIKLFPSKYKEQLDELLLDVYNEWERIWVRDGEVDPGETAYNKYMSLYGEAEARLVSERYGMSESQRKKEPPWVTLEKMMKKEGLIDENQKPEDVLIDNRTSSNASLEQKPIRKIDREILDAIKKNQYAKNWKITQLDNGDYRVDIGGGKYFDLKLQDNISLSKGSVEQAYGKSPDEMRDEQGELLVVAGSYNRNEQTIRIRRDTSNNVIFDHEFYHFLEHAGLITDSEMGILKDKIQQMVKEGKWETKNAKDIGGSEDRAQFIAESMDGRRNVTGLWGKIVQRIQDFLDWVNDITGYRSAESIVRDVASGKIAERSGAIRESETQREQPLMQKEVEAFRKANNLPEIKMRNDGSHPTQIATTKSTYRKIFENIMPDYIKNGRILDYGAGKNIGGKSIGADTFEPFPEKGFVPTYKQTNDIPSDSYDGIINNAVLNVVPDDIRDSIVKEIGRILKQNGMAFINVRGKDVFAAKHHVIDKSNMEVIIDGNRAYQKGFTQNELTSYLKDVLGDNFKVESAVGKRSFGAVGSIVTKIGVDNYEQPAFIKKAKSSKPEDVKQASDSVDKKTRSFLEKEIDNARLDRTVFHSTKNPSIFDKWLLSPMYKKSEQMQAAFKAATQWVDNKVTYFNRLIRDYDGKTNLNKVMKDLKSSSTEKYQRFTDYLTLKDRTGDGYFVKEDKDNPGMFTLMPPSDLALSGKRKDETFKSEQEARAKGREYELEDYKAKYPDATDLEINSLKNFRKISDNLLEMRKESMGRYIAELEAQGKPIPAVVYRDEDGKEIKINLKRALAEMNDLWGTYFPRLRNQGGFQLKATRKNADGTTDRFMKFYDVGFLNDKGGTLKHLANKAIGMADKLGLETMPGKRAELEKQGYKVDIRQADRLPENIFLEVAGKQLAIEKMMDRVIQGIDENTPKTLKDIGIEGSWSKDGKNYIIQDYSVLKGVTADVLTELGGEYIYRTKGRRGWGEYVFKDASKDIEERIRTRLFKLNNISSNVSMELAAILTEGMADLMRSHGARSGMLKRGEDYWKGFETDPAVAITRSAQSVAGGEAKRMLAQNLINIINGTVVSKEEFQEKNPDLKGDALLNAYQYFVKESKVDPAKQPELWSDIKSYMDDLIRNEEKWDRVVGHMTGLAVAKYLAFRVSAPIANLTAMVTTVPSAMNNEAGIDFKDIPKLLTKAATNYTKYLARTNEFSSKLFKNPEDFKGIDKRYKEIFDDISERGWDKAQYNYEAVSVLRNKLGQNWDRVMDWGMAMFGVTEQVNRATTIAASVIGMIEKETGKSYDKLSDLEFGQLRRKFIEKAHATSNYAHGVYGKADSMYVTRGGDPMSNIFRSNLTFKKFAINYMMELHKIGVEDKNMKAAAYMLLSPMIVGGFGASLVSIIPDILSAMGVGSDDWEEDFYKFVDTNFGGRTEKVARFGIPGLFGLNFKGSVDVGNIGVPKSLVELFGAPASVAKDFYEGVADIYKGNTWKGVEGLFPNAASNVSKGVREYTQGATKDSNTPIFFGNEPLKLDFHDAVVKALSFSPADMAEKKEILWNDAKIIKKYTERKNDILDKFRKYYLNPVDKQDKEQLYDLQLEVSKFNEKLMYNKINRGMVSPITADSIKTSIRRAMRPSTRERFRGATLAQRAEEE